MDEASPWLLALDLTNISTVDMAEKEEEEAVHTSSSSLSGGM